MAAMSRPAESQEDAGALTAIARAAGDGRSEAHKRGYLRHLPQGAVVDLGCGDGVFLDVARAAGWQGVGIDHDAAALSVARARGHEVHHGEVLDVTRQLAARGVVFDGAVLLHVIEHLLPAQALALLCATSALLRSDGVLVIATPNCANYLVQSETFWLDPTHLRPYPRLLVERLAAAAGFVVVESYLDPATRPQRSWWRAAIARLRTAISGVDKSGPLDLVVVCRRP
jgi:2-polyprenyl-3-methyl-5-hydroxy-6-metoxy-1,4-benzoquinol methylase